MIKSKGCEMSDILFGILERSQELLQKFSNKYCPKVRTKNQAECCFKHAGKNAFMCKNCQLHLSKPYNEIITLINQSNNNNENK